MMTEKEDPAFVERFTVRMPDGMRDAVAARAKANGRSMNSEIVQILQDVLVRDEFEYIGTDPSNPSELAVKDDGAEILSFTKSELDRVVQTAAEEAAQAAINIILKHYDVEAKKKPT